MSAPRTQGGWWLASDGNWYPPETHPDHWVTPETAAAYINGRWVSAKELASLTQGPTKRQRKRRIRRWITMATVTAMVVGAVWLLTRPSAASLSDFDGTGSAQAASSLNVPSFPLRISQILASSTLRIVSLGCSSDTYGQGSGWPIAPHYVVTAAHVVAGRHEFAVQVPGGKTYLASVASFSPSADVAVLYVPGTRFAALSVANADASSSPVLAAGYPGGGPEQLVTSTLSGISTQTVPFPTLHSRLVVIFEAPSIGPGDSGGPVINSGGQVVGMMIDAGGGEVAAALPSQMWGPLASGIGQTSAVGTGACPS